MKVYLVKKGAVLSGIFTDKNDATEYAKNGGELAEAAGFDAVEKLADGFVHLAVKNTDGGPVLVGLYPDQETAEKSAQEAQGTALRLAPGTTDLPYLVGKVEVKEQAEETQEAPQTEAPAEGAEPKQADAEAEKGAE